MKITVNGQVTDFSSNENLNSLIEKYCAGNDHVIAEVNGTIIKRPIWKETLIQDGDVVELVNLVGGG